MKLDGRRVLMIVRAGDNSLHDSWFEAAGEQRHFDVHLSYYGKRSSPFRDRPSDVLVSRDPGPKFKGIYDCLDALGGRLEQYDFIGFPDDDLLAPVGTWNRFVEILVSHSPALAQPALTRNSYYSHDILLQRPGYLLRWTNFVEVMCPFFSRQALSLIRPHLLCNQSGWGFDLLWRELLHDVDGGLCVVDETPVLHTRAVGSGPLYKDLATAQDVTPWQEKQALLKAFNLKGEADRVLAGVTRDGRLVGGDEFSSRILLMPRIRRRIRRALSINEVKSSRAHRA